MTGSWPISETPQLCNRASAAAVFSPTRQCAQVEICPVYLVRFAADSGTLPKFCKKIAYKSVDRKTSLAIIQTFVLFRRNIINLL
jgi:hypothetical protein